MMRTDEILAALPDVGLQLWMLCDNGDEGWYCVLHKRGSVLDSNRDAGRGPGPLGGAGGRLRGVEYQRGGRWDMSAELLAHLLEKNEEDDMAWLGVDLAGLRVMRRECDHHWWTPPAGWYHECLKCLTWKMP